MLFESLLFLYFRQSLLSSFTSFTFLDNCTSPFNIPIVWKVLFVIGKRIRINSAKQTVNNTLKHEFYYLYKFDSNDILDQKLYEFVYGKYNHVRPHRANGGLTPYAARCRAA
ncbi:integrase core domain-containing protein [Lactococcus lactis]|uniref:integrase core domain-containing protein n=1 Tax=Lactococcus lactis TaxID=1358 RepID=UPI003A7F883C